MGVVQTWDHITAETPTEEVYGKLFPLETGKKVTFELGNRTYAWVYELTVSYKEIFEDPKLGEIYCFYYDTKVDNKFTSYSRRFFNRIICPVYGMRSKYLTKYFELDAGDWYGVLEGKTEHLLDKLKELGGGVYPQKVVLTGSNEFQFEDTIEQHLKLQKFAGHQK